VVIGEPALQERDDVVVGRLRRPGRVEGRRRSGRGSVLTLRERWRADPLKHLLERLAAEAGPAAAFAPGEVLAAALAVTSFPTYDRMGSLADSPERAAHVINHLVRSLTN